MRVGRLLLLAALLLCAGCLAGAETAGDWTYTLDEAGCATVTAWRGTEAELTVPAALDGHPVTVIGAWAFENREDLVSVTLPEGVTALGSYAFCRCAGLTEVRLPESLTAVGDCCFILCTSLEEMTLPAGAALGANPFAYCAALTDLRLPEGGPLTLEEGVLWDRSARRVIALLPALTPEALDLPAGTRTVGRYAIAGCGALKTLRLPAGLTEVENYGVYHCTALERAEVPASLRAIGEGAFTWCDALTVSAPAGSAAEAYCDGLGIPLEADPE